MGHVPLRKKITTTLLVEVAKFGIRSVLRHHLKSERHEFVAVLIMPPTGDPGIYQHAALLLMRQERPRGEFERDNCIVEYFSGGDDKRSHEALERFAAAGRAIVFLKEQCDLPRQLALAVDVHIDIPPPRPEHFLSAARNCGISAMTFADAEYLATLPFGDIRAAMKVGRPFLSAMRRLREVVPVSDDVSLVKLPELRIDLAIMDQVVGHREIKAWVALLAEDIVAWRDGQLEWRDVDRGAVFSGPPGTGKTRLAIAIAEACGIKFIPTSAARWQSKGHLGDYLKAMRSVFDDAVRFAPSLVFIDEVDAVGSRERQSGDNEPYIRQAIAGLLEVLDGSDGREGVVVVAATNMSPYSIRPFSVQVDSNASFRSGFPMRRNVA